jgi:hypothetical protein
MNAGELLVMKAGEIIDWVADVETTPRLALA